jgi:hypothetical protein
MLKKIRIFIILEIILYYILNSELYKKSEKVDIKIDDNKELHNFLENELIKRVKKLENMNINDWYKWNRENNIVEFKNKKYYLYLWEKQKTDFINKVQTNKFMENLSWQDTYNLVKGIQHLSNYKTDKNLIENQYESSKNNKPNYFDLFWVDNVDNTFKVKKERNVFISFKKNDVSGVMGFPYVLTDNINDKEKQKTISIIGNLPYLINYLIVFLILIIILYNNEFKYLFLGIFLIYFVTIGYSFYFMNNYISGIHPTFENDKINLQSRNVSAIAFLSGVNIFIINHNKNRNNNNFILFSLLFSGSVFLLLLSIIQNPNVNDYNDILSERLKAQYFFNLCIIYNLLIIIIFTLSFF